MTTNHDIPDFDFNNDFNEYYLQVKHDYAFVKDVFPLLHLTILPTVDAKEIFIQGKLIPYEVLKKCKSKRDIERLSLSIIATYPSDYPNNEIYVEDILRKIDWNEIPNEHRHYNRHPKIKDKSVLCTHHPYGEINSIKKSNKTIAILNSAWKLYIQYVKYKKTSIWSLKDLKHDTEGTKQLKRSGKYHMRSL